jgi:catechol 2,3-dioxygenase-like lactoylglutathione lyase family enzyme
MRLQALRVFVNDLKAARHFYESILGFKMKWELEGTAIGFDLGVDLIIETVGSDADSEDQALVGRFTGGSIAVKQIEMIYAELAAKGVTFISPPERQPWGGVVAHFEDPSKNLLTLVES